MSTISVKYGEVATGVRFVLRDDVYIKTDAGAVKRSMPRDEKTHTFPMGMEVKIESTKQPVSEKLKPKKESTVSNLAKVTPMEVSLENLERAANQGAELANTVVHTLTASLKLARVAKELSEFLNPEVMTEVFMPLRNKSFGWREDKQYSIDVYHEVWVDMLLKGALPTGDEVLVIGGRGYLQKAYFARRVRMLDGLKDLTLMPGKVESKVGGALVEMTAKWNYKDKPMSIERIGTSALMCRLNNGQGADAALGKAERKILAQIFKQLTGSEISDAEPEGETILSATVVNSGKEVEAEVLSGTEKAKAALRQNRPVEKKEAEAAAIAKEAMAETPAEKTAPAAQKIEPKPAQVEPKPEAAQAAPQTSAAEPAKEKKTRQKAEPKAEVKPEDKPATEEEKAAILAMETAPVRMTPEEMETRGVIGESVIRVFEVKSMGKAYPNPNDKSVYFVRITTSDGDKVDVYDVKPGGLGHHIKNLMMAKKLVSADCRNDENGNTVVVFADDAEKVEQAQPTQDIVDDFGDDPS